MVKLQFFLANSIFTPIFKTLVRTLKGYQQTTLYLSLLYCPTPSQAISAGMHFVDDKSSSDLDPFTVRMQVQINLMKYYDVDFSLKHLLWIVAILNLKGDRVSLCLTSYQQLSLNHIWNKGKA